MDMHWFAEQLYQRSAEQPGGCVVWTGPATPNGYGKVTHKGKLYATHRMAYELLVGPIPPGYMVCHHCDNRPCVRPDHLFAGTAQDNVDDMFAKGRGVGPRQPPRIVGRSRKGANHWNVKLTEDNVRAIKADPLKRTRYWARLHGVRTETIRRIKSGQNWGHIT